MFDIYTDTDHVNLYVYVTVHRFTELFTYGIYFEAKVNVVYIKLHESFFTIGVGILWI